VDVREFSQPGGLLLRGSESQTISLVEMRKIRCGVSARQLGDHEFDGKPFMNPGNMA
jgi:hypothetical protein